MRRDERPRKRVVSSSRPIPRPEVPDGGPLRQLKELLHSLYIEAGTPVLDDIVEWIEAEYGAGVVPSVPSRGQRGSVHRVAGTTGQAERCHHGCGDTRLP